MVTRKGKKVRKSKKTRLKRKAIAVPYQCGIPGTPYLTS